MAKSCLLIVSFCCFRCTVAFAIPGLPPAHVIDTDTLAYVEIDDGDWQMLEDKKGTWTIEQTTGLPLVDQFHADKTYQDGIGFSIHTYWMRCLLKNVMSKKAEIFFYPQYADKIDYYFSQVDGGWEHETTGYLYPGDNQNIFHQNYYVPLTLEPGQEILVYVRFYVNYYYYINYSRPKNLHLVYGSKEKLIDSYNEENLFPAVREAVFFGILIIVVIYNLLFFWTVKERVYLYFSFFLLCFTLYYCSSFLFSTNFYHKHPFLFAYTANIWEPLYFLFEINFIRHFFKTWNHFPKWNKYLIVIAIFQLLTRIIAVFGGRIFPAQTSDLIWKICLINSYVLNLSILITFFIFIRKKTPYANILVLAALPLILYLTIVRSTTFAFDIFNIGYEGQFFRIILWLVKWNYIFYLISVFWLAIFFTLILFFRYKHLQKENAQQALEKERLAREKEQERNELIARQ
ncbi:MAG TPA: 7TM-DISM domain-containing protein, partial [Chitinophagaceae bacterium]